MSDNGASFYERRLAREIEIIEAKIAELKEEKHALQRQMIKARWEASALKDVNRKNSGNRIMVEERILEALRKSSKPLKNKELFAEARRANFELNPTTFRTYLLRLKEKGRITSVRRGHWQISEK